MTLREKAKIMDQQAQSTVSSLEREFKVVDNSIDSINQRAKNLAQELRKNTVGKWVHSIHRGAVLVREDIFKALDAVFQFSDALSDDLLRPQLLEAYRNQWDDVRRSIRLASIEASKAKGTFGFDFRDVAAAGDEAEELFDFLPMS